MKGVRTRSRSELIHQCLGPRRSHTARNMERAIAARRIDGWVTAASPEGPAYEQVTFVRQEHPMVTVLLACAAGFRWIELSHLAERLGAPPATPFGAIRLAKFGLAMSQLRGSSVELWPADASEARFVNEARFGPQIRGFSARRVIEAVMHLHDPRRKRTNINEERRLHTCVALSERWGIECEDLLTDRQRVRLFSDWTFPSSAPPHPVAVS